MVKASCKRKPHCIAQGSAAIHVCRLHSRWRVFEYLLNKDVKTSGRAEAAETAAKLVITDQSEFVYNLLEASGY